MNHWAYHYIGLPYDERRNCWLFVRQVQKEQFVRDLPIITDPHVLLTQARLFKDHAERQRWQKVDRPVEGDCVLLKKSRYPAHIGIWLEIDAGGIIHCVEGQGVIFQRLSSLLLNGWQVEGYYHFVGN